MKRRAEVPGRSDLGSVNSKVPFRARMVRTFMHLTRVRGPKTWRLKSFAVRLWPGFERARKRLNATLGITFDTVPEGVTAFAVLATARSGSTLLVERLASGRPDLRTDGEIFHPLLRGSSSVEDLIRRTYFTHTGHLLVGCKVLANQVSDEELELLLAVEGLKVVVLERKNVARQFVSHRIAQRDQKWAQAAGASRTTVAERKITVSSSDLLAYRNQQSSWYDRYRRMTTGLPTLDVSYEGLIEDLDKEIGRIAEFLGAGEVLRSTEPSIRRQNPEPLRELVANFDSLRDELIALGESLLVEDLNS